MSLLKYKENEPIYRRLGDQLREMIHSGQWQPGDRVPSERELSERYNISRMTARQALTDLVREGLVVRQQGKGSFVAPPKLLEGLQELTSFTEDMIRRGLTPGSRLLCAEETKVTPGVGRYLGLSPGEPVWYIERLRLVDDQPIALERVYLPVALCPDLSAHLQEERSLYVILSTTYDLHLARAEQTIEATLAGPYDAPLLQVSEKAPLLSIERLSYAAHGTPVELVRSLYRADRYRYRVELTRL